MQHDHALKKLNFYLLTISPRLRGGGGGGGLRENISYDVIALLILFTLICNIHQVLKKLNFELLTYPDGSGGGGGGLRATMHL